MKELLDFLKKQEEKKCSWTKEETKIFQTMNDEKLKELNATLRPSPGVKTGKVGIFCPGQIGDTAQVMGVLKYADVLWPNKEIVWFINAPNSDLLRYSNVSEVRPWPWAGFGLKAGEPDHFPYLCNPDNTLNLELAKTRSDTADLERGYFPATHQVASEKREGVEYSNVSKQVFGVPMEWDWHPVLGWSIKERIMIKELMTKLPANRKNILLETFAGSGQSPYYNGDITKKIMQICRGKLGACNFVFGSHKHLGGTGNCGIPNEQFFDDEGCISCTHLTIRQVALINNYCDLVIGLSSGVSVATSAWDLLPTPKIQWCGSKICSTSAIANGEFHLVESDYKPKGICDKEFEDKLIEVCETLV